jgi:iron(III) transport system ATP-binding protein
MPAELKVEELRKHFDSGRAAVDGVSFEVTRGEIVVLLGPSGCGKTTTLRCIAGLEHASAGRISIGGRLVSAPDRRVMVPPRLREIGMVFQSYAVWPHMSVFDNTAFPLRMLPGKRWGDADIRRLVMRTLETMELAEFAPRSAAQLSGGQQQRLALARALVAEPSLLLLDEPLSNLDALLREQMRSELRRLQKEVGVTAVYVTHDQSEALALSDRIAIMHNGRIVQIGTPHQIYHQPRSAFVATFVGRSNLFRGKLLERNNGHARIATALGPVLCQAPNDAGGLPPVAALIRPERVVLTAAAGTGDSTVNRFRGRVCQVAFLGETTEYVVQIGNVEILVRGMTGQYDGPENVEIYFPQEKTLAIAADEA